MRTNMRVEKFTACAGEAVGDGVPPGTVADGEAVALALGDAVGLGVPGVPVGVGVGVPGVGDGVGVGHTP
ncbi:MAG TPA: hypothetical protein VNT92_11860, partial [Acidimicrobiia bacterium]|nr:hypothetical protein [Acidimicrobiia bacterium]